MNTHRQMRVFVSSTFRDMHSEREQLVKRTFPQIRRLCEARGVIFDEVDLRWGIPDEQATEGEVVPTCLEEIQRCRPFFIGILGERYGTPVGISADLLARQPWLAACRECSLTELEILQGVLNDPAAAEHALFYFRDPAYLDRLPVGADPAYFCSEGAAASRLHNLKERIRKSGKPVREPFRDAEELGAWVESDLCALIDRLFPADVRHEPGAAAHVQFAAERRRHWVGREAELRHLDEMLAADPAVLVTGPPGVGLSAFLVNWAAAWRQSHLDSLVLEHYVGAHPGATSLDGCCRRLCLDLAAARNLPPPEVAVESDWPDLFVEHLALAGAECQVLLVIDHADGLKGRGERAGADWLPPELPPGARLVAAAGEEAVLAIERRGWPLLRLDALGSDDRAELVRSYLAVSGKALSEERVRQIAAAPATGKPFHLALLLEELRQYGENETLGDRLSELLAAPDVLHLCGEVFRRCESDYDSAVPDFTAKALGLLAVARSGLSDTELCELLGGPGGRLPQRPWSNLQIALKAVLLSRNGVVGFAQSEPARVAWERYVSTPARQAVLQRQLADFFRERPDTLRAAMELPSLLRQLAAWDELADWLSRPGAFRVAWQLAPEEVCAAWEAVEEHSPQRAAKACAAFPADLRPAAMNLLRQLGHWADALVLARQALQQAQAEGDPARQLETLLTVGEIELAAGSPYAAEEVFAQAEERATAAQLPRELLRALRGRAEALDGQTERVTALARPELNRRSREIGDRALRISEGTEDERLRSEALVLWLEDFVTRAGGTQEFLGRSGTRDKVKIVESFFLAMTGPRQPSGPEPIPGLDQALAHFNRTLDRRLHRLETEAVTRLRHTRHRSMALRADVAIAKAEGDGARVLTALEALRQHAAARDDTVLLGSVYEDLAAQHQGEEKLAWLQRQADLLARSGRQAALVRNWWTQAKLLPPERSSEALALLRRAARERRARPSGRERRRLLVERFLADDRLRRPAVWVFAPLFLWGLWRFCAWTATWFGRLPVFGCIGYLFAVVFGLVALLLLWQNLSEAWKALRHRLPGRKAPPAADSRLSEAEKPALVPAEPPRAPRHSGHRAVTRPADGPHPPKWLTAPFVHLWRLSRGVSRSTRIARRLGLNRLPARLAWFALAVPAGSALTLCSWRASGCTRILLLPLGLAGQMLILGAVLGLISPLVGPWAVRRTGRFASSGGSRIGFVCLLALIRLKRGLLGHRRRRAVAHHPGTPVKQPGEALRDGAQYPDALRTRTDPERTSGLLQQLLQQRAETAPGPEEGDRLGDDLEEQARALVSLGDSKRALSALEEWDAWLRASPRPEAKSKLLQCLKAQISMLPTADGVPRWLNLAQDLEAVARELGDAAEICRALSLQAVALGRSGDLAGALALHRQAETLYRERADLKGLLSAISDQARLCEQMGNRAEALALHRRAETICLSTGKPKRLRVALSAQALLLKAQGDLAGALAVHRREEALCRELGADDDLASSLNNQALVYRKLGREAQAMQLLREAERLHGQAGNKRGLLTSLSNQTLVLKAHGDLTGALELYRRQEVLYQDLGDDKGLREVRKSQERALRDLDRRRAEMKP